MSDDSNQSEEPFGAGIDDDILPLPPYPEESMSIEDAARKAFACYQKSRDPAQLDIAIRLYQDASFAAPAPESKVMPLRWAAYCLHERYKALGRLGDLESSITTAQRALEYSSDDHPDLPLQFNSLGLYINSRFRHFDDIDDLEATIAAYRCAVELTPNDHSHLPISLSNLALSLHCRFLLLHHLDDLEGAIDAQRRVVKLTTDGDHDLPAQLHTLGSYLKDRIQNLGQLEDLECAIEVRTRAIELTPEDHPRLADWMNELGWCIRSRFERLGDVNDIERAIVAQRRAVMLTPDGHPDLPELLWDLGLSLKKRCDYLSDPDDLERAIEALERAVKLTTEGHYHSHAIAVSRQELGHCLLKRYYRHDNVDDLERAVPLLRHHVELVTRIRWSSATLSAALNSFGLASQLRYERLGNFNDLELAISSQQRAVELIGDEHPGKPTCLKNLGLILRNRYNHFGDVRDLERAIMIQRRGLELRPDNHPWKVVQLDDLGRSLLARFRHEKTQKNFDEAISCLMAVTAQPFGALDERLKSAEWVAERLLEYSEFSTRENLVLVHSRIIDMIPDLTWLGHSLKHRATVSAHLGKLAHNAVAVAIASGTLPQAIEWLEAGRALIWSQLLSLRDPVHVPNLRPDLAQTLANLHSRLQQSAFSYRLHDSPVNTKDNGPVNSAYDPDVDHRTLAIEHGRILSEIRQQEGFEDFMRPPKLAALIPPPDVAWGAIVFLNIAASSCDALVLKCDGAIIRVNLPKLSMARAQNLRTVWKKNLESCHARSRGMVPPDKAFLRGGVSAIGIVLGRLWTWVVHPILEALDFMNNDIFGIKLPHITWCPTGPLTSLPLHAAGVYTTSTGPHTYDFVVSSYTPSLSALRRCHEGATAQSSQPKVLMITQPKTPRDGLSALPATLREGSRLRAVLPKGACTPLDHEQATVPGVLSALDQHPWVHFACHGSQNLENPLQSAFELYDGPLALSALINTVADNAELAFLSACQTATGDDRLSEESAHLAAGMIAVGFKGVIATMWSIRDEDGPSIVETYYPELLDLRGSGMLGRGETGAAYALHHAVAHLRKEVGEQQFVRWAPFVHFGV